MNGIDETRIAVIGLGYVGLPLAVEFSRHFPVIGFDILAVAHKECYADSTEQIHALGKATHIVYDIKDVLPADAADGRL